ncbi:hypothetical protein EV586_1188 [Tumebacillus sp. BK434]|uniref:hypothetical protein n=1 Tax=Tumebacillus sp. BK434 TaxID=2512169 RepID=UPI001044A155|nr:hypothetical protein [Tumebacillus sp. BK434]TCP52114.1 hypothetical protein EV586_1188 [Tumebacillus sp. BK434]
MWQEAWKLVEHDVKRVWWNYLVIMFMSVFFGGWTAMLLRSLQSGFAFDPFLLDIYFLAIVPVIGCPWYTKKYTERTHDQLLMYRTLPISTGGIALSRILLVLLRAVPNTLFLFGTLYLLSPEMRAWMAPSEYVWFVLIWFGYGAVLSCWYPFWELNSGSLKKFYLYSAWYLVLWIVLGLTFWLALDRHVVQTVMQWAQGAGWPYALLSILFSGLGAIGWWQVTRKQLENKASF